MIKKIFFKLAIAFIGISVVCGMALVAFSGGSGQTRFYYEDPLKKDTIRYTVFSDTHFYGSHALNDLKLTYGPDTFYTGDIYDLKNAHYDDHKEAEAAIKALRERAGKCYVRGNHEIYAFGKGLKDEDYYTWKNGIMFTHGHYRISYTKEKVEKWEKKKGGNGRIKRAGRKILEEVVDKPDKPGKKFVENAVKMVKEHNARHPKEPCHTIVFGHTHVEDVFVKTLDGIRVINVPRGVTYLDL